MNLNIAEGVSVDVDAARKNGKAHSIKAWTEAGMKKGYIATAVEKIWPEKEAEEEAPKKHSKK